MFNSQVIDFLTMEKILGILYSLILRLCLFLYSFYSLCIDFSVYCIDFEDMIEYGNGREIAQN